MFTPEKLIISGTEHKVISTCGPRGNRSHHEIRIGNPVIVVLLSPRLFNLVGSLAMLRDVSVGTSSETGADQGFVHHSRLNLSKNIIKQYIFCARTEIHAQIRQAHVNNELSRGRFRRLMQWQVFESGASAGRSSCWRWAMEPDGISVSPAILGFPDFFFRNIAKDYFRRHPVFLPDSVRRA